MSYMLIDISIDLLRAWEHLVGLLVVLLVLSLVFRVALVLSREFQGRWSGPNFAGGSGDGESHSHLQKKEVWISEKHYREQETCAWFVHSDVREDRHSMVLFLAKHIHTSLKDACLFWQSDDECKTVCFACVLFLNMASEMYKWTSCIFQLQDLQIDHQRCADAHCPSKAKMLMSFCSVAVLTCMLSLF